MTAQKPPMGVKPRHIHDMERFREIIDAINRYSDANLPVPKEWVREIRDIYYTALDKLQPIERTAEWIIPTNAADSPSEWRECSLCGEQIDISFRHLLPNFCEGCGAKMKNGGTPRDNPRP